MLELKSGKQNNMAKLTLSQVNILAKKMLNDGYHKGNYNQNWSRHIDVDYYTKIQGWSVNKDKDRITIITSRLYNLAPYQRNRAQKTFNVYDPKAIQKLKVWLNTRY